MCDHARAQATGLHSEPSEKRAEHQDRAAADRGLVERHPELEVRAREEHRLRDDPVPDAEVVHEDGLDDAAEVQLLDDRRAEAREQSDGVDEREVRRRRHEQM